MLFFKAQWKKKLHEFINVFPIELEFTKVLEPQSYLPDSCLANDSCCLSRPYATSSFANSYAPWAVLSLCARLACTQKHYVKDMWVLCTHSPWIPIFEWYKICGCYVITFLNRTPRIDWYVVRSKSKHHKHICLKEIELGLQIVLTTLHSIVNSIGRTYVPS